MTSRPIGVGALAAGLCFFLVPAAGAEDHPAPATAPAKDAAKTDAPAADLTRYAVTLDDDGILIGVILTKTAQQWVIKTDAGLSVAVPRTRIRLVRLAPPKADGDAAQSGGGGGGGGDHPQGDRPPANPPPAGDHPHSDRPQGDRPQGDRPAPDRPQGGEHAQNTPPPTGGDRPRMELPADRGAHPHVKVHLKDGKTITGTVEKRTDRGAVIKTDSGDMVTVNQDQVQSFE